MHWFDVGVGIALLIGGVWSFFRGLTREVLSILGIIAAVVLSAQGYPYVAAHLERFIPHPGLQQAIGFGLIFVATMVLYVVFATVLRRLVKAAGLSLPDRVLGGLFGLIKVSVVVSALLLVTTQFFPTFATQLADESILAPTLFRTAHMLSTLLPERVSDEFHQVYRRLSQRFPTWPPTPARAPKPAKRPPAVPPRTPSQSPDGISESDARALEKILQERLRKP